jgi:hypothetical protein
MTQYHVALPTLHTGQVEAFRLREDSRALLPGGEPWAANAGGRFKAVRCGRRWGKTKFDTTLVADKACRGQALGFFAPDYKKLSESYEDIKQVLKPVITRASKMEGVIRTVSGGRIDFWTLNDENAGRSRFYHGVVIDEGAFTTNGSVDEQGSMLSTWDKAIKPTLLDYQGWALVTSNTNGENPENFLYAICNDPRWGFINYHAPSISNPLIPMRLPGESDASHWARRKAVFAEIEARTHPLVFRQEYLAEFVDWSGVAFFDPKKWLVNDRPVAYPASCDYVFAIIDSATKTGTDNDATAVTYFAVTRHLSEGRLLILDWDATQIEGDLLIDWLPTVFQTLESLALRCGAREGSIGALIEDKASGEILIKQAERRALPAEKIDSRLTALGKDERALSISGYHYCGLVKISEWAYDKVVTLKGTTRNHLISQVSGFRMGDKDAARRADDLLDTYCYGVAVALGDSGGF